MRVLPLLLALSMPALPAHAQWKIQDAHTTSNLRGIDTVPKSDVAWASGTDGTILRTADAGVTWLRCTTPPKAEHLDFRGIQALDEDTAVVMSSGKGNLSRLYKTTDACKTWKLVFDDPDETGFFDSLRRVTSKQIYLLGDPVDGKFSVFLSTDRGETWAIADDPGLEAAKGEGVFAASNSSLAFGAPFLFFGTGGIAPAPHVFYTHQNCPAGSAAEASCPIAWGKAAAPLAGGTASSGVFSLASRTISTLTGRVITILVAVGGDYEKPDADIQTAALSTDGGKTWIAPGNFPRGYRSSVVFDQAHQTWIAVGPNGTDVSRDDAHHWTALKPPPGQPDGTEKNWNAISLPFVVGPNGRIGKLQADALQSR